MRRRLALLLAIALGVSAGAADGASAAMCRDQKGRTVKCPTETTSPTMRCRDVRTKKPARCGAPNTEAVPTN